MSLLLLKQVSWQSLSKNKSSLKCYSLCIKVKGLHEARYVITPVLSEKLLNEWIIFKEVKCFSQC